MKSYQTVAALLAASIMMLTSSFAQGEFLSRGTSGIGASVGVAFSEGGAGVGVAFGASIKGVVDIGAEAASDNSNHGTEKCSSVAPYMAYHMSKQSDSVNQVETIVGVAYFPGIEKHLSAD
jgi:hypothetical protein